MSDPPPSPPARGADHTQALQAFGKRIQENSTLYHIPKSTDGLASPGGTVQLPPKKQKLDNKGSDTNNNNSSGGSGSGGNNVGGRVMMKDEGYQQVQDPYLSMQQYEQYQNLLSRVLGRPPHQQQLHQLLQQQQQIMQQKTYMGDGLTTTSPTTMSTDHLPHHPHYSHLPVDSLMPELGHYEMSSLPTTIDTTSLSPSITAALNSSLSHHLALQHSLLSAANHMSLIPATHSPITNHHSSMTTTSTTTTSTSNNNNNNNNNSNNNSNDTNSNHSNNSPSIPSPSSPGSHFSTLSAPSTPPNTAHAVALLTSAENQKIQRKKANQQEREVLEKYYNDHYIDQSVKIRKEDLTELSYQLNWHVLRVQGWMHTHRQSRSDYNPPKRTKRRATLPQEQDILKHYFKIWTEQGLIDLHSPTRVTPKDYEMVATTLGWDNERVRRWTDHYKQKIKAAAEGAP